VGKTGLVLVAVQGAPKYVCLSNRHARSGICHVRPPCTLSRGFYRLIQIFLAQLETAIELSQSKGVDWHYFCVTSTEIRVRTFSGGDFSINDFFSAQFTSASIHKCLKLFPDSFLTISDALKNLQKNLPCLAVRNCSVGLQARVPHAVPSYPLKPHFDIASSFFSLLLVLLLHLFCGSC
jgi:hypothetical protein